MQIFATQSFTRVKKSSSCCWFCTR